MDFWIPFSIVSLLATLACTLLNYLPFENESVIEDYIDNSGIRVFQIEIYDYQDVFVINMPN